MLTQTLVGPSPTLVGHWPHVGATLGVLLGSPVLTGLVAWAFHAHEPNRPKWKPALIIGGGSAVAGLIRVGMLASATSSAAGMFGVEPA
jgi:hypothetical protein